MSARVEPSPVLPPPAAREWEARDWWIAIGLLAVTLLAYLPALQGGFIWNDEDYVTQPALRSWSGLARIWFEVGATEQYYPLLHSAFWIQHRLWGDSALGYHVFNVLLHAANAVLLARVLRQLRIPGAWLAAAVFALHPVCVESAAWIAEQKNTLSTFFYLLTAIVYLRFDRSRDPRTYALASLLYAAALLSKSLTATLTGALLVVIWWQRGRIEWKRDVIPLLPWIVIGGAFGLFSGWFERKVLSAEGADFDLSLLQRALLAPRVAWFYLAKLLWPAELIFIYPRWEIQPAAAWQYVFPALLLALLAALWFVRQRTRAPLAALLFFLGSLFPVSGFFNVYGFLFSYVADHWQYLPCIGILTLAAAGLASVAERARLGLIAQRATSGALLALLAMLTWKQSGLYRDIVTFYEQTIAANPKCWMAYNNLGIIHADAQRWPEAIRHYETALQLKPDRFEIHNNLGLAYVAAAKWQDAINHFERAIQLHPRSHVSYLSIGTILRNAGRNDEAAAYYRRALEVNPNYIDAYNNLGLTLLDLRKPDEAVATLQTALRLKPDDAVAHNNLGVVLTDIDRHTEAETHFRRAIAIDPRYIAPYDNFGNLLRKLGRLPEAIETYRQALTLVRDAPITLVNLTIALTDAKRFAEAVEAGQRAVQVRPDIPEAHFNLAVALHGAGRLAEAQERYATARKMKPALPVVPALENRR
jgi:protein O-mannosyl-transferase